jgi:EamA domain-containing membrane protein RarD
MTLDGMGIGKGVDYALFAYILWGLFHFYQKKIYKNLEILLFIMTKEHKEVEQLREKLFKLLKKNCNCLN